MGGDNAPDAILEGADQLLGRRPGFKVLLFGDQARLKPALSKFKHLAAADYEIVHTDEAVAMDDKPSQVLRKGRNTSMWLAIQAVKEGRAHAVVSAGNTGALMALSKFQLRTMEGIDRPALVAIWPGVGGDCAVLDLGANVDATSKQLADFAIMGMAFAKVVLHKPNPRVALLNIGEEELKGHEEVREAAAILKDPELGMDFRGFIEGNDILQDVADVVVTDGFTGNIALKTAEGTATTMAHWVREAFSSSLLNKIAAFMGQGAFRALKAKMDPRRSNGAVFLGLNGIVVKSHGGTDGMGFASAIEVALELSDSSYETSISETLSHLDLDRKASNGSGEGISGLESKREVAAE